MGSQDLQQARYDQLVRRVGALYGGGSKVVEVLPELFPVIEVENTTPELIALSGWRTAWQSTERTGTGANLSTSQLFNPVGSNQLVVVTRVDIAVDPASVVQAQVVDTVLAAGVSGLFRDSRFGVPRSTVAQASSLDGGSTGGGLRYTIIAFEDRTIRDDNGIAVLAPGTGFQIGTTSPLIKLTINYWWRERLAQESELSFP